MAYFYELFVYFIIKGILTLLYFAIFTGIAIGTAFLLSLGFPLLFSELLVPVLIGEILVLCWKSIK